jgi:chemotaxis protein methyltransferase CheR
MLSDQAFTAVTDLFHRVSGSRLGETKPPLVEGHLHKLALRHGISDLDDYAQLLRADPIHIAA